MQVTFKPIIIQGGARKGGNYPVYIRVYFDGSTRRLPTTLVATPADLTRSGRIKNATLLARADVLIARMREALGDLSLFELETMDVDSIVGRIRASMRADAFRLDFFQFGNEYVQKLHNTAAGPYRFALRALERFIGHPELDINEITRKMLVDFGEFLDNEPKYGIRGATSQVKKKGTARATYLSRLARIFEAAKFQYNDEDSGKIPIPRSPFSGVPRKLPPPEGQKALPVEVVQALIDTEPASRNEDIAIAVFLVSFLTMGANMADLYEACPVSGDIWTYNRKKTRSRRADKAEIRVQLLPELSAYVARLGGRSRKWWLPALHGWSNSDITRETVNAALGKWAERHGVQPFTFYAARHTWATLARRAGVEKATVDEALGHVGDYRVADIYAERNWALAWDANRRVADMFRWEKL